jgi:hypothetical protein
MYRVIKLPHLLVRFPLQLRRDNAGYRFDPRLAQQRKGFIELVGVSFDVVEDAVGTVLALLPSLEKLERRDFLVLEVNQVQGLGEQDVVELEQRTRVLYCGKGDVTLD